MNRVDEILETFTPPEVFTKYLSFHHVGKDKIGCPGKNSCYTTFNLIISILLFVNSLDFFVW